MGDLSDIFCSINNIQVFFKSAKKNGRVCDITVDKFKDVISCFQKLNKVSEYDFLEYKDRIIQMNEIVLMLLTSLELQAECQIVGSKTLCAGYILIYGVPDSIKKFSCILSSGNYNDELSTRSDLVSKNVCEDDNFKVCLCLAMLELNANVWNLCDINYSNRLFLNVLYSVCERIVYRYSSATLMAFRCLVKLFEILSMLNRSDFVLEMDIISRTMNIVMSNWDNPLTGVREQNTFLFQNFFALTSKTHWINYIESSDEISKLNPHLFSLNPLVFLILTQQTWMMKSKYFLLSTLLKIGNTYELLKLYESDILNGLKVSLQYMHLVPAGSDLYKVCIANINPPQWKGLFLPLVLEVFSSDQNSLMKQNIINYWLQPTIKTHIESFDWILNAIKDLPTFNDSYCFVSLFKIGRKEGFIKTWNLNDELCIFEKLKSSVIDSDEIIRSEAFLAICIKKTTYVMPSVEEIDLIQQFLIDNINYDSSRLRQSIINSFTTFCASIHDSFVFMVKDLKTDYSDLRNNKSITPVMSFLSWLHDFLIENLENGCNFQRKYTSLSIYQAVLNCTANDHVRVKRQKQHKKNSIDMKQFMERFYRWDYQSIESRRMLFDCILDPSECIRNVAVDILSKHFNVSADDKCELLNLYKNGLALCSDRLFYQAESGALIIKIVAVLQHKSNSFNVSLSLDEKMSILDQLLDIAEDQRRELLTDILKAATNGAPLHGILMALTELLTVRDTLEFSCVSVEKIERLLSLIECVVENLLNALALKTSSITDFAPSFADMGESISCLVQQSTADCLQNDEDEDIQLSSTHQLILNCIWLNIKACCILAEKLITSSVLESNATFIQRCVDVLGLVLCKCRHKGAIESAGMAIMHVTKYLTAHKNAQLQRLPSEILNRVFENLIPSDNGSVSRKSAGLAILVHRIIAGDNTRKKPLLHNCVMRLIETASRDASEQYNELVDLPQTRAIHFLCSLVQDSSLRQDMTKHIHTIATLCFTSMSSSIWTIRNASLQLFGALLPKLIGQKKHQESEDGCESYMIAFEELYFHVTNLFKIVADQFESVIDSDDITLHSKLMPSLTLLSSLTITMHACLDKGLREVLDKYNAYSEVLISSPVYHVRKLCAKINSNFCSPLELVDRLTIRVDQITTEFEHILKQHRVDQNRLHGLLFNVKFLVSKFFKLKESMSYLIKYEPNVLAVLSRLQNYKSIVGVPYFTKGLLLEIFQRNDDFDIYKYHMEVKKVNKFVNVGCPLFYSNLINSLVMNSTFEKTNDYINVFLYNTSCDISISFLEAVKLKVNCFKNSDITSCCDYLLQRLIDFIIHRNEIEVIKVALDVMFTIILKLKNSFNFMNCSATVITLHRKFFNSDNTFGIKCCGLSLPIICSFISNEVFSCVGKEIVNIIYQWSSPDDNLNEDLRLSSVSSLIQLIDFIKATKLDNEDGLMIWKSVCNLLQDENVDIRIEITKFLVILFNDSCNEIHELLMINPYVGLCAMYKLNNMEKLMDRVYAVKHLWGMLDGDDETGNEQLVVLNPFDHGVSNIYKEDVKIIDLIFNELTFLKDSSCRSLLIDAVQGYNNYEIYNNLLITRSNNCKNASLNDKKLKCRSKILKSLFKDVDLSTNR